MMIKKIVSLKNNNGLSRYLYNTSWMLAEQFLRIVAGLVVGIWVARHLGPNKFGTFSYVLALVAIFGGIAKLGLDGIMVRELVNHPDKRDSLLGTAFGLKIIGSIIVVSVVAAVVPFTSNDATTNLFILIVTAGLLFQSFDVVEFYFQSQVKAKVVSICKVVQLGLSSVTKVYLIRTDAELIWFVLITALDVISLALGYYIAYRLQKNPPFYKRFELRTAKQLLKDSWPLILSAVMISLYMKIDQIMIKEMLGVHDLGVYSAAIKLTEGLLFVPTILSASLFPAILSAKTKGASVYYERLLLLYRALVFLAFILAVVVLFTSSIFVDALFGADYSSASNVLSIYAWANVFIFLQIASAKWYLAENLQLMALLRNASGLVVNVVLNILLIPIYGIEGAAVATVASYAVSGYLADALSKKTMSQFKLKTTALVTFFRIWGFR